ncbi:MAG: putative Ig domain-containing protein [Rhizobiales bacterium]|nr:putative Ig domain-containing protein [Hyphomicrobiales bacterium]
MTVTGVNDAPTSTALANQTGADASSVNLDVSGAFSDPDATDALAFSASGLPAGLSIDPVTGVISGTIDHSASASGPYSVTVTATDPSGATTSQTFTWTVTNPAPAAQDDGFAASENTIASGNVLVDNGSGADADPDGDALTVSAVNGVAGNVGSAVAGGNGGSFTIGADGTLSFDPGADFNDLAVGETRTTSVTYTISDGEGGTSTATATVTVTGVNDAPTSTALANQTGADASSVNLDVSGAFSDPDATDALAFSASGLPAGLSIDPVTGVISGTIDHSASASGPYSVTVTATDPSGATTSQTFTWTVTNPAPAAQGRRLRGEREHDRERQCARRQRVRRGRRSRRRRADGVGGERRRRQCRFGGGGRQWRLVHDRRGWNAELRSGRGLQ